MRDADAAELGQRLEPGGDVDRVAVNVVIVDDDVAEIDPYAPIDAGIRRVAGVASAGATEGSTKPSLALPDKPSIAVLPFQNMSGDPEQEYFADGMVERSSLP